MSYEIIEKLKKEIEGYKDEEKWEEIGKVIEVSDGIVKISGLGKTLSQEILSIETSVGAVQAVALNLEEETIGALVLGEYQHIKSGDIARNTGQVLSIEVGPELTGRVIDPLGNPSDGKGPVFSGKPAQKSSAQGGPPPASDFGRAGA